MSWRGTFRVDQGEERLPQEMQQLEDNIVKRSSTRT